MGIVDGLIVLGIVGFIFWVIYGKLREKNPRLRKATDDIGFNFNKKLPSIISKPAETIKVKDEEMKIM